MSLMRTGFPCWCSTRTVQIVSCAIEVTNSLFRRSRFWIDLKPAHSRAVGAWSWVQGGTAASFEQTACRVVFRSGKSAPFGAAQIRVVRKTILSAFASSLAWPERDVYMCESRAPDLLRTNVKLVRETLAALPCDRSVPGRS